MSALNYLWKAHKKAIGTDQALSRLDKQYPISNLHTKSVPASYPDDTKITWYIAY